MAQEQRSSGRTTLRGFASMDQEKQREIARKGGANVPNEKRSFAQDRALASEAGRKGGRSVAPQDRSFTQNRALAAAAGRKGGQMSQSRRQTGALAGRHHAPAANNGSSNDGKT
jgi:general stress protein YciG